VVLKLFNIVQPAVALFGQKDLQQAVVLKKLVSDLNLEIDLRVLATVRENDGLALSSRNSLLSERGRKIAPVLYQALLRGKEAFERGREAGAPLVEPIVAEVRQVLGIHPEIEIDYVSVVDSETMQYVDRIERRACLALAVTLEKTRLIDNIVLG
jgi:pantoate--beta-alanine ligase